MAVINSIKGFKDILPDETGRWRHIEEKAREVFCCFGVKEIRTPVMEKTELFRRGIGATTDIVEKEMYTLLDRGDESLSLRPEATASIIRAYVEHSMYASDPVAKLFTIGPMFRSERPQKGRFRQFHQINVEFLGLDDPRADGEIILLLTHFLESVGLAGFHLEINSLGCPACRPAFREAILKFLKGSEGGLCKDCQRRLGTNSLRVLDCKLEQCRGITAQVPMILDFLCPDCSDHFSRVRAILDNFGLAYKINHRMVRGLDYYTKTAFEVTAEFLGAQNAVAGGGRYDSLVSELGGPDIAGIGFAIGMERLISLLPEIKKYSDISPHLFIAAIGEDAVERAFALCDRLRMKGLRVEMDYTGKSLKGQMKRAGKLGSRYTLIVGEKELTEKKAELRDMEKGTQETIGLEGCEEFLINILIKR
ncbi:MAG TPA: histidine--tRNA ligase [Syntrophales bacterium]|nr:histidine--tRNA ligase [Syntrophales bacterium]